MDPFEDILNECIQDAIEASDVPASQKYVELKEAPSMAKAKALLQTAKTKLTPNVVKQSAEAAKQVSKTAKRIKGLATATFAMYLIKKARDAYRTMVHKRCAKFQGDELNICKIKTIEYTISQLNSYKSECSKTKNPKECTQRINDAIAKLMVEKDKLKNKVIRR